MAIKTFGLQVSLLCGVSVTSVRQAAPPVLAPPVPLDPPVITSPGAISGTRGDGNTINGTAATATGSLPMTQEYQYQFNDGSGWGIIVDANAEDYVDTLLTQNFQIRRRVTFTNAAGSATGYTNVLSGLNVSSQLRLVRLSTIYFPDTAVEGDILATVEFAPVGSTISVTTEDGIADAFTADGFNIRAGAGYAGIECRTIVLHILVDNGTNQKLTVIDVDKYSAGPANAICTSEAELDAALAAASATSTKYVIELNKAGGAEWNRGRTITLRPTGNGQVIMRAAGGLNATKQRFNGMRLDVLGGRGFYGQNIQRQIRLTGQELQDGAAKSCCVYTGTSASVGPYRWFRSPAKGGVASYAGIDPDQSYDPTIQGMARVGDLFYFRANYPTGTAGPITSIAPYDPTARAPLPAFTSAANPSGGLHTFAPQYIGDNQPGGVLPNMTGWPATGGIPLTFDPGAAGGTGAAARFKAEYLEASDPRAYAGAGNYATELYVDSWGTGYLNTSGFEFTLYSCWWNTRPDGLGGLIPGTRRSLRNLATGEYSDFDPTIYWSECRFEDLGNVLFVPVKAINVNRFMTRCLVDRYALDVMPWGTSSAVDVKQDWGPLSPKIRVWGCIFGRALGNAGDAMNPHFDIFQLFAQGGKDLRYYVDWVRNVFDAGQNTRGSAQCLFFTDSNPVPAGYLGDVFDGFYFGHLQRGGIKSYSVTFTSATRMHKFLSTAGNFSLSGKDGAPAMRRDQLGSYAHFSDVIAAGAVNGLPKSLQVRADNVTTYNNAHFPAVGTYPFIDSMAKAVESFTPLAGSASEGHTPVDDMDQFIDWIGGGFDPDAVPIAFPFAPKFDVESGDDIIWSPRQIHWGVRPVSIASGEAGTLYQTGGAPDFNGDLQSPSAWTSASASIPRGTWFKPRRTAPVGAMQQGVAHILLNNYSSEAIAYTRDKATPLIISDAATGSFLVSTNPSTPTPSSPPWNAFRRVVIFGKLRVPFPYIPAGNLTLFKGSATTTPTDIYLTSYGNLRMDSGGSSNMGAQFDRPRALIPGGDYNFVAALNYNVPPYETANPTPATALNPDSAQVYADFLPMPKAPSSIFSNPSDDNVPLTFGLSPRIFADEAGAERPVGWGLYHFGIWADTETGLLPDFSQWDVLRRFTSQFMDGDSPLGAYPGKGIEEVLGPGLRLLVRGDLAEANGAGLPNLAPVSTAAGGGSMSNFVLGSGSPPFTGIIVPTEPNYPIQNNGFASGAAPKKGTTSLNLSDWEAQDVVELLPGERMIVAVSSDGTTQVLEAHPDSLGAWTMIGRAAIADATLHIFTCENDTTEVITARLRVVANPVVAETMASITYKLTPRMPGASIEYQLAMGTAASNPPPVTIPQSQKCRAIVFRARAGNLASSGSDVPPGYELPEATSSGTPNTTGTRIGAASRNFEGTTEDPAAWAGATGTDAGPTATVLLWEVPPGA